MPLQLWTTVETAGLGSKLLNVSEPQLRSRQTFCDAATKQKNGQNHKCDSALDAFLPQEYQLAENLSNLQLVLSA